MIYIYMNIEHLKYIWFTVIRSSNAYLNGP